MKPKSVPKLWIDGLDLETDWIESQIQSDREIMKNFGIASYAIKNGKYKGNKQLIRMKLEATRNEFMDCFLVNFLKKKSIVVKIIVDSVKNYWKRKNSYEGIMEELDKMIKPEFLIKEKDYADERRENANKVSTFIKDYYNSQLEYKRRFGWERELHWRDDKAEMEWRYFYFKGVYRFNTKFTRKFYLEYKREPYSIIKIK